LKWLREQGCPWNEHATATAASAGQLDILMWAIENGCLWHKESTMISVKYRRPDNKEMLAWLANQKENRPVH